MHKMMERSGTLFRDPEDVEQATRFLHENGRFKSRLFIFFSNSFTKYKMDANLSINIYLKAVS